MGRWRQRWKLCWPDQGTPRTASKHLKLEETRKEALLQVLEGTNPADTVIFRRPIMCLSGVSGRWLYLNEFLRVPQWVGLILKLFLQEFLIYFLYYLSHLLYLLFTTLFFYSSYLQFGDQFNITFFLYFVLIYVFFIYDIIRITFLLLMFLFLFFPFKTKSNHPCCLLMH